MARLRLVENLRTLGYAPFYFGLNRGHWEREGLEIAHIESPATSQTATLLLDGAADVSWGGPMRVMLHHHMDPACPLVCFAQVVARDPFVLVGREPNPHFRFTDLVGKRIGFACEVPTPWLTIQDDIARAGVDPLSLDRHPDRPMAENAALLASGALDVVQLFEPYIDDLVQSGRGHVWHRCTDRGDIGYTTFYATRETTTARRADCQALVRGMRAALADFHAASPDDIASALRGYFPDYAPDRLARIVATYRSHRLWAQDTALPPAAFLRLKAALVSGGLIAADMPYTHIVDADLST